MTVTCECTENTSGLPCHAAALWVVAVGARTSDAQASCGTHLSRTCSLMFGAENRRDAVLTITAYRRPA
jgi:hypothetical protein